MKYERRKKDAKIVILKSELVLEKVVSFSHVEADILVKQ